SSRSHAREGFPSSRLRCATHRRLKPAKRAHEPFKEKTMSSHSESNRVLLRLGARELTPEEIDQVSACGPPCRLTFTHLPQGGGDEDTKCPKTAARGGRRLYQNERSKRHVKTRRQSGTGTGGSPRTDDRGNRLRQRGPDRPHQCLYRHHGYCHRYRPRRRRRLQGYLQRRPRYLSESRTPGPSPEQPLGEFVAE